MNKIVKKILMCEPKFYEINYVINPWMKIGSVNKKGAFKQWENLLNIYQKLGIKVEVIEPKKELPDMVFTADQGIVYKDEVLLSSFCYWQRRKENQVFEKWFEKSSYKIRRLPGDLCFEGNGDCLWFGKKLLMGFGFRTQQENVDKIKKVWEKIEVLPLQLINPYFYHLDTCLFVLNDQTIFYYPEAFSKTSEQLLKKIVPNLIKLEKKEAFNFAANSVVTDHQIICQGKNFRFVKEVERLGYKTKEIDISEFNKSGGGIHCLTGVLEENIQ